MVSSKCPVRLCWHNFRWIQGLCEHRRVFIVFQDDHETFIADLPGLPELAHLLYIQLIAGISMIPDPQLWMDQSLGPLILTGVSNILVTVIHSDGIAVSCEPTTRKSVSKKSHRIRALV